MLVEEVGVAVRPLVAAVEGVAVVAVEEVVGVGEALPTNSNSSNSSRPCSTTTHR